MVDVILQNKRNEEHKPQMVNVIVHNKCYRNEEHKLQMVNVRKKSGKVHEPFLFVGSLPDSRDRSDLTCSWRSSSSNCQTWINTRFIHNDQDLYDFDNEHKFSVVYWVLLALHWAKYL